MINRNPADSVDEAIDCFEENWSPDSRESIGSILQEHGLAEDPDALTELIRIDIELRYKQGFSFALDEYFEQFNGLLDRPRNVSEIAFEDFRSRSAYGRDLGASRWRDLPGVRDEPWYQHLIQETSRSRLLSSVSKWTSNKGAIPSSNSLTHNTPTTDAFQVALADEGFRIIHKIASGAFSDVFLATQNELADRYVVLKVVEDDLSESRTMAMLMHTNIVPIYSQHRILSRTVICMPYTGSVTLKDINATDQDDNGLTGQSLITTVKARISETKSLFTADSANEENTFAPAANENAVLKPLELLQGMDRKDLTAWLFSRLAAALAHSHARGILHGDLKPSNVLIRNDGEPALLDFNLSQSLKQDGNQVVGGTLPYMAPETCRAMMRQQSQPQVQSDIYALGVMMFQFATGRLPHVPPNSMAPVDLELGIETRKRPADWKETDDVPVSLRNIIDRCLAFDTADRYESAENLRVDLQNNRANRALLFAPEPRAVKVKKWLRRNPSLTSAGTVATVLVAGLIPVLLTAMHWRQTSHAMLAEKNSQAFLSDSTEVLTQLNAAPNRAEEKNIRKGVAVLTKHRIFAPDGSVRFVTTESSSQHKAEMTDAIHRHTVQMGILEAQKQWVAKIKDPDTPLELEHLDRLIADAKLLPISKPSRSIAFLDCWRSRLVDESNFVERRKAADLIVADSDTELYLEAVRTQVHARYAKADKIFQTLVDRKSISTSLRSTLVAWSQYDKGEFEEAKLSVTQSIQLAPESSRLYTLRGMCHRSLGEHLYAIADFTRAIELEADSGLAWSQRGLARLKREQYDAAIEDFSKALEIVPGDVLSLVRRSEAYQAIGKSELAKADVAAARQNKTDSALALIVRSLAIDHEDPEAALADLELAAELEPNNYWVYSNQGKVLSVDLHRYEDAVKAFNRAIELDPHNERVLIDRAIQLARMDRDDDARASMAKAMEIQKTPRTLYQAACVYALMPGIDNHRRGLTYLAKALHAGYDAKKLDTDEDLESLRALEGFRLVRQAYQISKRDRAKS